MRNVASFLLALAAVGPATGQAPAAPATGPAVRYAVAFPNAVHHEARITATFAGLPAGPLHVRMARSSPGRYALHEFAKNVYDVAATDGARRPLALRRPDPYGWDVAPAPDGTVQFSYTLYGDRTDGTYAGIDAQHAHLNAPATLCYATGLEDRPAEVTFELPAGWQVATQLRPGAGANTFTAPNLQYLMDSPVSLGAQQVRTWQVGGQTIELAVLFPGPPAELDAYAQRVQRVVQEERAIFGELPAYDFGRYTFIADYLPQASGDGMEHRNSTSLTSARALRGPDAARNLGTVAHEFFHAWNVERLRPRDLEPFDFQRANMSASLWFAEGFTQYYGRLALRRAQLITDEEFFADLARWVNLRQNNPGPRRASALDLSRQAPFVDAATSIDPTNVANAYLSYYDQGAGLALALDLELRRAHGTTLDQFMRAMWQQHGQPQRDYAPARPYTLQDWQRVLGEVSRDTAFAGRFFRQHVAGVATPPFADGLRAVGLALVPAQGLVLAERVAFDESGRCRVAYNTLIGSGLYQAGLDRGDQLVALDGQALTSPADLDRVLGRHTARDVVPAQVKSRAGEEKTVQLVLDADPNGPVVAVETLGKPGVTAAQKALRAAWLGSRAAK